MRRLARAILPVLVMVIAHVQAAGAQDQGRTFLGGGPFLLSSTEIQCTWYYWWDPPTRFIDTDVGFTAAGLANGRSYSSFSYGIAGALYTGIVVDGTYVSSGTATCGSGGALDYPTYIFPWESHQGNWDNPTCSGVAGTFGGGRPATDGVSYSFDANVTTSDWDDMRQGFFDGGSYWPSVGSSPSVSNPMSTPIGGDRTVKFKTGMPSNVAAEHDYALGMIWVNPAYKNRPQGFWAVVGAHELGHALNSTHCSGCSMSDGIMADAVPGNAEGLSPRNLDKCWIVKYLDPQIVQIF